MDLIPLLYIRTTFEHKVQNKNASEKVEVLSNVLKLTTFLRHEGVHQRASAFLGYIKILRNQAMAVIGVEDQEGVNIHKILEDLFPGCH